MHDAVVAVEIVGANVADILAQFTVGRNELLPGAAVEQAEIAAGDGMALRL